MTRSPARARKPVEIIPADDEVFAIVGPTSHEDMDVWVLCVPMVDGDPIEPSAEVARGMVHELAGDAPSPH